MIPDLIHWLLTGIRANEWTNASTTQTVLPDWYTNYAMGILSNQQATSAVPYAPYQAPRIAAARRMTTTAEGVETEAQLDALHQFECTEMQGYLFSKPLSAADIKSMLTPDREPIAGTA